MFVLALQTADWQAFSRSAIVIEASRPRLLCGDCATVWLKEAYGRGLQTYVSFLYTVAQKVGVLVRPRHRRQRTGKVRLPTVYNRPTGQSSKGR